MSQVKNGKEESPGTLLRKRRTLRGHSLEAVYQHTRIPKNLLDAIERDDFGAFPARVYYRGFLKNYCDFLEVDFDPLWKKIEEQSRPQEPPPLMPGAQKRGIPPAFRLPKRLNAPAAAAALVLLLAAFWIFRRDAPAPEPAPVSSPPRRTEAEGAARPHSDVRISVQRDAHLRLRVDGVLRFEGRIPAGAKQDWSAEKTLSLRTADPGAVFIRMGSRNIVLTDVPMDSGGWRTIDR